MVAQMAERVAANRRYNSNMYLALWHIMCVMMTEIYLTAHLNAKQVRPLRSNFLAYQNILGLSGGCEQLRHKGLITKCGKTIIENNVRLGTICATFFTNKLSALLSKNFITICLHETSNNSVCLLSYFFDGGQKCNQTSVGRCKPKYKGVMSHRDWKVR